LLEAKYSNEEKNSLKNFIESIDPLITSDGYAIEVAP